MHISLIFHLLISVKIDFRGRTPFHLACERNKLQMVRLMVKTEKKWRKVVEDAPDIYSEKYAEVLLTAVSLY